MSDLKILAYRDVVSLDSYEHSDGAVMNYAASHALKEIRRGIEAMGGQVERQIHFTIECAVVVSAPCGGWCAW